MRHMIIRLELTDATTYGVLRDANSADPRRPDHALTPAQNAQLRASGAVKFPDVTLVDASIDKEGK